MDLFHILIRPKLHDKDTHPEAPFGKFSAALPTLRFTQKPPRGRCLSTLGTNQKNQTSPVRLTAFLFPGIPHSAPQ
ncbi:MAG: hypothetical protein RLZZ253_2792 [Verrucomicrobiota bacterium]